MSATKTNSNVKVVGDPSLRHFVRLESPKYGKTTRPIDDRDDIEDLDKVYDRYETFSRVYITVEIDGERYDVKSSPLAESGIKSNPNFKS